MPTAPSTVHEVQPNLDTETTELNSQVQVEVTYYTDPLCSWSWALEPQWRRLCYEFGEQLTWRYSMGGLISNWQNFSDPLNDICRPVQMGPQWVQIRHLTGMPINEHIWVQDPPASSYPACIAVKAAQRQGMSISEAYLRRLREAVMLERGNIARQDVLLALAEELTEVTGFDIQQFQQDLDSQEVLAAFREDIRDARYQSIGRFPALILRPTTGRSVLIIGYRPYPVLREAIAHIAPQAYPIRQATDAVAYATYWGRVTAREVAEALELNIETARQVLEEAVADGRLTQANQIYLSPANIHS